MSDKITRRDFIRISAMTAVAAMAASCAQPTPEIVEKQVPVEKIVKETVVVEKQVPVEKVVKETVVVQKEVAVEKVVTATPVPSKFKEAPTLMEMVKAGKLPPVEDRVPEEPLVVQPNDKIGKYGGSWHMGCLGLEGAFMSRTMDYEQLLRWDVAFTQPIANLCKSWEVSPEGSEFTFNLRRGLKWSDGEPLTADDFEFQFADIQSNTELNPKLHGSLILADEPVKFTKVDDFTIKFAFAAPNGSFIINTTSPDPGARLEPVPGHYMKQFHATYANKADLDKLVKDASFQNWYELFGPRNNPWQNPDRPTVNAWLQQPPAFGTLPEAILERNPYYWKVDPEGQQLPYIDKVIFKVHQNRDTILMDALAGQIDMQYRHIEKLENLALLQENSEKGGFHFFKLIPGKMNTLIMWPNQCHKDPVQLELYRNQDFRIALSYGVDRQEVINVIYAGQGEPWQAAPLRGTPYFNENMAKRYTEYKPDLANEMLDKIVPNKDNEGFRLRPDGQRLLITVETPSDFNAHWIDILQIWSNQWKKIGVDLQVKTEQRNLYTERSSAGEPDAVVWEGDIGVWGVMSVVGKGSCGATCWNPCWIEWFNSDGKSGSEPPEIVKQMSDMYEQLKQTTDPAKQREMITQLQDMEPLWGIGTSTMPNYYGVVKNNFYNVPPEFPDLWIYPTPAPTNTCQYWIDTDQA